MQKSQWKLARPRTQRPLAGGGGEVMVDSRGRSGRSGGQPPGLGCEEIGADKRNQPNDDEKSKAHVARPPERNLGLPHCGDLGIPERSSRAANGRESITGTYRRKRVLARLITTGVRRETNTARITRKIYRKHANTSCKHVIDVVFGFE
jgi:hypothetical protein